MDLFNVMKPILMFICKLQGVENISQEALELLFEYFENCNASYNDLDYINLLRECNNFAYLGNRCKVTMVDVKEAFKLENIDIRKLLEMNNEYIVEAEGINLNNFLEQITKKKKKHELGRFLKRPNYIPGHFPAFPSDHTYKDTSSFQPRIEEISEVRELQSQQKRLVEMNLKKLIFGGEVQQKYSEFNTFYDKTPLVDFEKNRDDLDEETLHKKIKHGFNIPK